MYMIKEGENVKTAIVTGSTKGIGKSIGLKLLQENCFVVFNYASDDSNAEAFHEELEKNFHGKYKIIKADLSTIEQVKFFVEQVVEDIQVIDYLILNAGYTDRTLPLEVSIERWNKVMDINLNMPFFCVQKFAPFIRNMTGKIIFIGSIMGIEPHASSIAYGVSKAGVHFLAKCLVKVFAEQGITVNAICAGFTDTEWQLKKPAEQRKNIENKTALHRFAYPEEIAEITYSVLNNTYINGSVIQIDGGYNYK